MISNSSTFRGFLEANGLDDMLLNPCGCIFGTQDESQNQIPIPGQAKYAKQRANSQRGHNMRNGGSVRSANGGSMRNGAAGGRGLSRQTSVLSRTSMPAVPENGIPQEDATPPMSPFAILFGAAFVG